MDCNTTIDKNNLVVEFDITKTVSTEILNQIKGKKQKQLILDDFGLAEYDLAKTFSLNESKTLTSNIFELEPVRYYNPSGNLSIHNAVFVDDLNVGKYLNLSGDSHYNGVYKYDTYEFIDSDFSNGLGVELTFKVDDNTLNNNSTIFFMGTRAVDKYNEYNFNYPFRTEVLDSLLPERIFTTINDEIVEFILLKEEIEYVNGIASFKSKPNIEWAYLYNNTGLIPSNIYTIDYRNKTIESTTLVDGTYDFYYYEYFDQSNVFYDIKFEELEYFTASDIDLNNNFIKINILDSGHIEITMFDNDEYISFISDNIVSEGWNHIYINFKPYNEFIGIDVTDCNYYPIGQLKVYINGLLSNIVDNVPYVNFKPLNTPISRQLGLPYNIFWGGDSFGLKHSFLFNEVDKYSTDYNEINYDGILEQTMNNSFTGGLQKLRIYNRSKSSSIIRNNYLIESENLGINKNKGGRLIYV